MGWIHKDGYEDVGGVIFLLEELLYLLEINIPFLLKTKSHKCKKIFTSPALPEVP